MSGLLHPTFAAKTTPAALACSAMSEGVFGVLAGQLNQTAVIECLLETKRESSGWPWENQVIWSSAVARELLLARSCGMKVVPEVTAEFGEAVPFRDGPCLEAILDARYAVAAFPLDQGLPADIPPWATIWVIEGPGEDHRASFLDGQDPLPEESSIRLFVHPSTPEVRSIRGHSWHLAASLARIALKNEASDAPKTRRHLAMNWIATGEITGDGRLIRIGVGNKLNLRTSRRWLFPAGNRVDVVGHLEALSSDAYFPATVDAAWSFLTGKGFVDGGIIPWPEEVTVLHSFTSGAWQPVMASLLLAAPKRLVLWHSGASVSREPAENLAAMLTDQLWTESPPRVEVHPLGSEGDRASPLTMSEIRNRILAQIAPDFATGYPILFNITQGNRLMALAAHEIAKLHSNLWLIYRDLDAPPFEFTSIRYEGAMPVTQIMRWDSNGGQTRDHPASEVPEEVWDALFFKPNPRPSPTPREIAGLLGGKDVGKKIEFI